MTGQQTTRMLVVAFAALAALQLASGQSTGAPGANELQLNNNNNQQQQQPGDNTNVITDNGQQQEVVTTKPELKQPKIPPQQQQQQQQQQQPQQQDQDDTPDDDFYQQPNFFIRPFAGPFGPHQSPGPFGSMFNSHLMDSMRKSHEEFRKLESSAEGTETKYISINGVSYMRTCTTKKL